MLTHALLVVAAGSDSGWTIAAAVGTVSAVIVALTVPLIAALWRWWKRPKLRLRIEGSEKAHELAPDRHLQNTIWVAIGNADGRNRADGVELFATIEGFELRGDGESVRETCDQWVSTQSRISFSEGRATSTVPANFWRRARLGVVMLPVPGESPRLGFWSVASDEPVPIHPGMRYEILLTVTADHVDARSYIAELVVGPVSEAGKVSFRWTSPPAPIEPDEHRLLPKIVW